MEHPTCKTCPYWNNNGDAIGVYPDEGEAGDCQRFPPKPDIENSNRGFFAVTLDWHWCGEHPDLPAYIASMKENPCPTISPR